MSPQGDPTGQSAVFVLPLARPRGPAPVAAWVTTGGWASGAADVLGAAWVLAEHGVLTPEETAATATARGAPARQSRRWRRRLPEPPITFAKDVRKAWKGTTRRLGHTAGPWQATDVRFVWQRHELFRRDGFHLAKALDVPLVLSVHAMQIAEARNWGVRRPGWMTLAERLGEIPSLRDADLVACVSAEVAREVQRRGVPVERVIVTPNGVDTLRFRPKPEGRQIRRTLRLEDRFVVGWAGSFRAFHGLELALHALAELRSSKPPISLLLLGDGQERAALELRAKTEGLDNVVFAGSVPYERMPDYLSACDAGLVLSPPNGAFHFSPVKLREYMACGLPVIGHAVGELRDELSDGRDAVLVPPNDRAALAEGLLELAGDTAMRTRLAKRSRELATERWSWTAQVVRVLAHLP